MKKAISILTAVVMTLCMALCLCACSTGDRFIDINDAYEKGIITQDDLYEIAYYYYAVTSRNPVMKVIDNNGNTLYEIMKFDEEKDLSTLSNEEGLAIKNAIYENWEYAFEAKNYPGDIEPDTIEEKIEKYLDIKYFGMYNGYYAINIYISSWGDDGGLSVGNISFFIEGNIYLYK